MQCRERAISAEGNKQPPSSGLFRLSTGWRLRHQGKYGDRRDVPQLFDEWKLANVPSVPGLYVPFAQTARDKDGVPGLLSFTSWAATPAAQDLRGGSTQPAGRSVHRYVR